MGYKAGSGKEICISMIKGVQCQYSGMKEHYLWVFWGNTLCKHTPSSGAVYFWQDTNSTMATIQDEEKILQPSISLMQKEQYFYKLSSYV